MNLTIGSYHIDDVGTTLYFLTPLVLFVGSIIGILSGLVTPFGALSVAGLIAFLGFLHMGFLSRKREQIPFVAPLTLLGIAVASWCISLIATVAAQYLEAAISLGAMVYAFHSIVLWADTELYQAGDVPEILADRLPDRFHPDSGRPSLFRITEASRSEQEQYHE